MMAFPQQLLGCQTERSDFTALGPLVMKVALVVVRAAWNESGGPPVPRTGAVQRGLAVAWHAADANWGKRVPAVVIPSCGLSRS